ncbi:MAG: hypothetical protein CL910_07570 [Deltaproteobacteria bacterium]|jgi:hypothetical protein|nr:hypothetical protein [Deltaproteobacteria bacterium]
MQKLRVIQGYTGDIAQHQIRVITACPSMEIVGAYVHHEEKKGLDAGVIAGIDPLGVRATTDLDEILSLDADCVLYNPPMERYDEIIPMLASGKNVVSIMAGWNPKKRSCFPEIAAACEAGQSSLYGTGLNPGLSYELALLGSSICTDIDSITIKTCEPQASLSEVFLQMFGFGKTEEELAEGPAGVYAIFARTLQQETDLLCEELGLPHDGSDFSYEFEPATRDYEDKIVVRKGTMAGLLVKASTTLAGAPVATIELRFLLGTEFVREGWLEGGPSQGWIEVDVRGTPGSRLTHDIYSERDVIGTWSTGTKAINALPFVCAAKPGLLSPLDLPLGRMLKLSS